MEVDITQIISLFRTFDSSNDGFIDRSELTRLLWALNSDFTESDLNELVNKMDSNRDGLISYEEFVRWIFSDTITLDKLTGGLAVAPRCLTFSLHLRSTRYIVNATEQDTVQDLRLRVCSALRLPFDELQFIRIRCTSSSEFLADSIIASKLKPGCELEVVIDRPESMLGVSVDRIFFWKADDLRVRMEWRAPGLVRDIHYAPQVDAVSAIVGKDMVVSWSATESTELWRNLSHSSYSSFGGTGTAIFVGTEDGVLRSLDAFTGVEIWTSESKISGALLCVLCIESFSLVFAGTDSGEIYAYSSSTGSKAWKQHKGSGHPEISQLIGVARIGAVFSGDSSGNVVAWDAKLGTCRWRISMTHPILSLGYRDYYESLIFVDAGGQFLAVDGSTGEKLFEASVQGARLVVGRRQNCFVAQQRTISSFDTVTQKLNWEVELEPQFGVIQTMSLADSGDDALCVGTSSCMLVLSMKNGDLWKNHKLKDGVSCLRYAPRRI